MMKKYIYCFLSLVYVIISYPDAGMAAVSYPPNWPWRGITVISNSISEEDIRYLANLNVNSLEIFLNTRTLIKSGTFTTQQALQQSIQRADFILNTAKKYGMTCVITMSHFPISSDSPDMQNTRDFWDSKAYYQEVVETAKILARHFRKRGNELGAYELISEPLVVDNQKTKRPDSWLSLMNDIVKSIRKYDAKRYIVVTPGPGGLAAGYKNFLPLSDRYIIYGAHMYLPHAYTHQGIHNRPLKVEYPGRTLFKAWDKQALEESMAPLIEFQNRHNVIVWIGEFSAVRWAAGADTYLKDLIDIFDSHNWGWSYWCYNDYHGWDPDYSTVYSSDDPADWSRQIIGRNTSRWKLLQDAFSKNKGKIGL
jgi:hypothetical protein